MTHAPRLCSLLLAAATLAAGCQLTLPPAPTERTTSAGGASAGRASVAPDVAAAASATPAPAVSSGTPADGGTKPAASGAPRASASPLGPATPAPIEKLLPPAGNPTRLAGTLRLDPGYLVAAGAGNVISHNGGQVLVSKASDVAGSALVAAGAGNVISHNGSLLVAQGGQVLTHNGGAVLPPSAGIVGQNGMGLVAAGAGNLVAAGGGNLVAAGAGNLVAAGAGNYALAQAAEAPASDLAPVAGVEIAVRSMRTGAYLPVGVDGHGQPVYVVYTNAEGGYELFLPEGESANVLIEANVARGSQDRRLEYQQVSGVSTSIDEDTAQVTEIIRKGFAANLRNLIAQPTRDEAVATVLGPANRENKRIPPVLRDTIRTAFGAVWDASHAAGLDHEPDRAVQLGYVYALADAMMRTQDLASITLDPGTYWDGAEEPAIAALVEILRLLRKQTAAKLAADPKFFDGQPWFQAINERAAAAKRETYVIRKPSDLNDLMVNEYFAVATNERDFSPPVTNREDCSSQRCSFSGDALRTLLRALDANDVPARVAPGGGPTSHGYGTAKGWTQENRIQEAEYDIVIALVLTFVSLGDAERDEILAALRRYRPSSASASPT